MELISECYIAERVVKYFDLNVLAEQDQSAYKEKTLWMSCEYRFALRVNWNFALNRFVLNRLFCYVSLRIKYIV